MSAGIDIEPQAVTSARENISLNGIESSKMSVYLVPSKVNSPNIESAKGKFDIVIANILMNPLMELAEDIVSYGKPEAVVGVSGILCEQVLLFNITSMRLPCLPLLMPHIYMKLLS